MLLLGDLSARSLTELRTLDRPKFGVYGNHCGGRYLPDLGATELHRRPLRWRGIALGGLNGCLRYKAVGDYLYEQADVERFLAGFPTVDLFLSHCPPRGVNDESAELAHRGWDALRVYVEHKHPRYLLHGHTHPRDGEEVYRLGTTQIEWVFGTRILELDLPGYTP